MQKWEKFLDECIREIAKENKILDIGSGSPFQKEMRWSEPLKLDTMG